MGSDRVTQLTGKRPLADARGVGLDDPQHIADAARADTRAGRSLARNGVRAGHIGIGAMVHVQEGPLGPLEQHPFAVPSCLLQHPPGRLHIGQDLRRDLKQLRQ